MTRSKVLARRVVLGKGEHKKFKWEAYRASNGKVLPVLLTNEIGDCVYVTKEGCSVHSDPPLFCQEFDCRELAKKMGRLEAKELSRKIGNILLRVWQKGHDLLKEKK
jgi:Fe-S-cluster containining protein